MAVDLDGLHVMEIQFHVSILYIFARMEPIPIQIYSDGSDGENKVVKRLLALDSEEKEQLGTYILQFIRLQKLCKWAHIFSNIYISFIYIYIDHEGLGSPI